MLMRFVFSLVYFLMPLFVCVVVGSFLLALKGEVPNPPFTIVANIVILGVLMYLGRMSQQILPIPVKVTALVMWSAGSTFGLIAMLVTDTYTYWILIVIGYAYAVCIVFDLFATEGSDRGQIDIETMSSE